MLLLLLFLTTVATCIQLDSRLLISALDKSIAWTAEIIDDSYEQRLSYLGIGRASIPVMNATIAKMVEKRIAITRKWPALVRGGMSSTYL